MKIQRGALVCLGAMTCFVVLLNRAAAHAQNDKYACPQPNPQSLGNTSNTCGSNSAPFTVKRDNDGASASSGIPDAKGNSTFFVKTGTTIVWMSTLKNRGFAVDSGWNEGWYSEGLCISGAIPGTCGPGRQRLLLWRQIPTRRDSRHRLSPADHNAYQRFVFARNLSPLPAVKRSSPRGTRHDRSRRSSLMEWQRDRGAMVGAARSGPRASREGPSAILEHRAGTTSGSPRR
jgi:hypothetical protein